MKQKIKDISYFILLFGLIILGFGYVIQISIWNTEQQNYMKTEEYQIEQRIDKLEDYKQRFDTESDKSRKEELVMCVVTDYENFSNMHITDSELEEFLEGCRNRSILN